MEPPPRPPPQSPPKAPPSLLQVFPTLPMLGLSTPHQFITPTKQINDGQDVSHFLTSKAYRDIGIFILQLNRSLCPRKALTPGGSSTQFPLIGGNRQDPESVKKIQALLNKVESFIEEAPPDPGPRRFGNVAFRKWYGLVEERVDDLLRDFLPSEVLEFPAVEKDGKKFAASEEIKAYLLGSFGSAQRLDYGTGHELSFLAFLGCLWKLGGFKDGEQEGPIERSIVLGAFESYLRVIRKLILTYNLEPAGSHGVWGLDDHSFLPYLFGSAQLTRPITDTDPMPLEGSLERAPKPKDVIKPDSVSRLRETNMYFSAIGFINDVKKGPFWEHSPILYDISGIKDGWGKINKGMIKMFNAEVLGKFPVVQHFPFGSLFEWERDPEAVAPVQSMHMANQPTVIPNAPVPSVVGEAGVGGGSIGTKAPWASTTKLPPATGASRPR